MFFKKLIVKGPLDDSDYNELKKTTNVMLANEAPLSQKLGLTTFWVVLKQLKWLINVNFFLLFLLRCFEFCLLPSSLRIVYVIAENSNKKLNK